MPTTVIFPLARPTGVLAAHLEVTRLPQLDGRQRNIRAPELPRGTTTLIESARDSEPASDRKLEGIGVRVKEVTQQLTGQSYGLALAIADKIARFGLATGQEGRTIWATGIIRPGGAGEVDGVEQFEEKFRHIIDVAQTTPTTFVYPIAHAANVEAIISRKGRAVQRADIELYAISTLNDAEALWAQASEVEPIETMVVQNDKPNWPLRGAYALAGAAIVGLIALNWPSGTPTIDACDRATARLDTLTPETPIVERALKECKSAVATLPNNARAKFLYGEALAVSGDANAARKQWRRAAELGDPDAMAAVAYIDWIANPTDRTTVIETIRKLEIAANQGAESAPTILASILMDGRAVPPDPVQAGYWIDIAKGETP